ncbi:MAG: sel1 repeat family protein [Gammaproteobacteria bacterium]|nr:sel1 repeat family protein [Gammaproteobacteria bacterium]
MSLDNSNNTIDNLVERAEAALRKSDGAGALYLYKALVKKGYKHAYCEIGNIYELGVGEIDIDYKQAHDWYMKSVDDGDDPIGAYCLGRIYYLGRGKSIDYEKAEWYYKLAADSGVTIAQLMLGRIYNLGLGNTRDIDKARQSFQKAAKEGYVYALKNLGSLEISCGNILKGVLLYVRGIWSHLMIYINNKRDPRIRSA